MLDKIQHTQEAILNIQESAEEKNINNSNASELLTRDKIENTPYYIVGNPEIGYFLAMGNQRLTEHYGSIEAAKESLTKNMWNIIVQTIIFITEQIKKMDEITLKKEGGSLGEK